MSEKEIIKLEKEISKLKAELKSLKKTKKFGLVWEEKEREKGIDDKGGYYPFLVQKGQGFGIDNGDSNKNILIEGDNYHALEILNYTHKGKVDVIYIDPPYNTGEKDFIYNDSFVEKEDGYRHSKWLTFIKKRLLLSKKLLKKDGIIFISIDDNEAFNLKLLCDEIFRESNFIGNIIRNTNSTKSQSNYLSITYDHTFIYARNEPFLNEKIKASGKKWEVEKNNTKEYIRQVQVLKKKGLSDAEITLELKELTKYPRFIDFVNYWYIDKNFKERGVYRKDNLGGVKDGNMTPIINPLTKAEDPVPKGGFRFSEDKMAILIKEDRIHFHNDGSLPTFKRYLLDNTKQRPKGIMSDDQRSDYTLLKNMKINFNNPKQLSFLERIFSIFSNDILVLDFFAGSASTAHALLNLNKKDEGNRNFILCTNNENNICEEATYPRIEKVINGYSIIKPKTKKRPEEIIDLEGINSNLEYLKIQTLAHDDKRYSELDIKAFMVDKCKEIIKVKESCFDLKPTINDFLLRFNKPDKDVYILQNIYDMSLKDYEEVKDFINKSDKDVITLYILALQNQDHYRRKFNNSKKHIIFEPLPENFLKVLRKIQRKKR